MRPLPAQLLEERSTSTLTAVCHGMNQRTRERVQILERTHEKSRRADSRRVVAKARLERAFESAAAASASDLRPAEKPVALARPRAPPLALARGRGATRPRARSWLPDQDWAEGIGCGGAHAATVLGAGAHLAQIIEHAVCGVANEHLYACDGLGGTHQGLGLDLHGTHQSLGLGSRAVHLRPTRTTFSCARLTSSGLPARTCSQSRACAWHALGGRGRRTSMSLGGLVHVRVAVWVWLGHEDEGSEHVRVACGCGLGMRERVAQTVTPGTA